MEKKQIIFKLGKYTLTKEDEMNFGLYETKQKGSLRGEKQEGTTDKLIGYYGYIDTAMSKIVNLEVLNASDEYLDAEAILIGFRTMKDNLEDAYHIRPKEL